MNDRIERIGRLVRRRDRDGVTHRSLRRVQNGQDTGAYIYTYTYTTYILAHADNCSIQHDVSMWCDCGVMWCDAVVSHIMRDGAATSGARRSGGQGHLRGH